MRLPWSLVFATPCILMCAYALSSHDIPPSDLPVSALLVSAQSHLVKGEINQALVYYDVAISRDPRNYLTRFKRATTYLSLGRTAQATDDFYQVIALKPDFEGAHIQLARLRSKHAEWDSAREEYSAAQRGPKSPEVIELSGAEVASKMAEDAASNSHWEDCVTQAGIAIAVASRSSALRELRARCRFERLETEEGLSDLKHILYIRPSDTVPHVIISATSFFGLGDVDNGITQIRKCLHSDPESIVCKSLFKTERLIQRSLVRTETLLSKGQFTTAGRLLVGKTDEPGLLAIVRNGEAEMRQLGRIPPKIRARLYEKVVELVCQAYSEMNHKEAEKFCAESLHLDAGSFWALIHRAKVLLRKEEFESAIETIKKTAPSCPKQEEKVASILRKAEIALKRSKTKDYYKVLGVPRDAAQAAIKSAYRRASKQHHPDKAAKQDISKEVAERKMAAINEAYEVLSDPELRARFDSGDDPNSHERASPFQNGPFDGGNAFHMFHQQDGSKPKFRFQFGGGGPFGF